MERDTALGLVINPRPCDRIRRRKGGTARDGARAVTATQKALRRAGLTTDDLGLIEINEAFAVQSLAVIDKLQLNPEIVNVNGGAVALGHPLGCSGARILTTLLHEMARRAPTAKRPFYGLATLCVGVGQGEATIVEWLG